MTNYQKLFPNYTLTQKELDWCKIYESSTTFEPTKTEDVKDQKSFIGMCEYNESWFNDFANTAKDEISQATAKLR